MSSKVEHYAHLRVDNLPMLCGRRSFGEQEGTFLTATQDVDGLGQVWTLKVDAGGLAHMEPVDGLPKVRGLRAVALDNSGRAWAVQVDANGAKLMAANQSGWPSLHFDLAGVVRPDSDIKDLIVDIWGEHRAVIADAGGDGALIVNPVYDIAPTPRFDQSPPWRIEDGVGRSIHFTDRPMQSDGPARLALFNGSLVWGVAHGKALFRLPTAALATAGEAPMVQRWLERSYESRIGGLWADWIHLYSVDPTSGALMRYAHEAPPELLLTDDRLVGAVRLTVSGDTLFALTPSKAGALPTIWRIG